MGGKEVPIGSDIPNVFYVSPNGDDLNPGTRGLPWRSLGFASERLKPGDTLELASGEYTAGTTGVLSVDCRGLPRSGRAGNPITVRAENERSATVRGDAEVVPLRLEGCAHWVIEGIVFMNKRSSAVSRGTDVGSVAIVSQSREITLRRLVLARSNNQRHSHLLRVLESEQILVEECEGYDFHHNAFEAVQSVGVTFRRNYLHSRGTVAAGRAVIEPPLDKVGIQIEESSDGLLENNLAEAVGNGFSVVGRHALSPFDGPAPSPMQSTRLIGNLVRDSRGFGFRIESRCKSEVPCEAPERVVKGTLIDGGVVLESGGGVSVDAAPDTRIQNVTAARVSSGFQLFRGEGNLAAASTASVLRSVARRFQGVGFWADSADDWQFDHCAAQSPGGVAVEFSPPNERVVEPIQADDVDACVAYLGAGSALRSLGGDGQHVGADIVYRTVNGLPTPEPLWDEVSGSFPCGAVVAGLNDDPRVSCRGAHERFGVGTAECPLPYTQAP